MNVVMRILGGGNSTWLPNDENKTATGRISHHCIRTFRGSRTLAPTTICKSPSRRSAIRFVCWKRSESIVLCHCRGDHHSKSRNIRHPCTVGMDESFYGKDGTNRQTLSNDLEYPHCKNRLPTKGSSFTSYKLPQ